VVDERGGGCQPHGARADDQDIEFPVRILPRLGADSHLAENNAIYILAAGSII
jgi:hypothetical protein